jgi:spore germination protein KA/spore germination protein
MAFRDNRDTKKRSLDQAVEQLDYRFIDELKNVPLQSSLKANENALRRLFTDCSDVCIRKFQIQGGIDALIVFVDGMINTQSLEDALRSIMTIKGGEDATSRIQEQILPVSQLKAADNYGELLDGVLSGDTALLVDNDNRALLIGLRGGKQRSVSEPETESVIRGPREGFVENLRTNTSLLRRKIKTPRLKIKPLTVGRESNTNVVVCYMEDIANPALVEEVVKRIKKIDIGGVLESGFVEEFIQDNYKSPFPQLTYTERPDAVAAALLQGRVAIMVDGTPMAMIAPFVFWEILLSTEDYFERYQISTLLRWLRYVFLLLSLITPAFYVAITTFHQDLLPTSLMLSVATARESIPFPAIIEALIMEVTFEALREAGIRLPKAVGSAVSILGALVVGQAAVDAGIVSAPMVIVVSLTGIASFTIPRFGGAIAIRMLRFPLMIAAAIFGLFGILLCILIIVGHLASLRSFGVPYLSPVSPLSVQDLKDALVRSPWPNLNMRPSYLDVLDEQRVGESIRREILDTGGQNGSEIEHDLPNKGE